MKKGCISLRIVFNEDQTRYVLIIDIYLFIMHR